MKFRTQQIAYWFFASALLLLVLQIVYGFIMGFAHMGYDNLHEYIPFNTARAVHTNLLIVWLLLGFMGSAYFIIPEEADRELAWPKLAYVKLITFLLVGVTAIVRYPSQHLRRSQIPRDPSTARLPRCRQRAALPRQHRLDHLDRKTVHHHGHRGILSVSIRDEELDPESGSRGHHRPRKSHLDLLNRAVSAAHQIGTIEIPFRTDSTSFSASRVANVSLA